MGSVLFDYFSDKTRQIFFILPIKFTDGNLNIYGWETEIYYNI